MQSNVNPEMYRIGIVVKNVHIFSNGLIQNAYFLYETFLHLGHTCTLLCYDKESTTIRGLPSVPIKPISTDAAEFDTSEYNMLITVGIGISPSVYAACRKSGTRVIGFVCGNMLANATLGFISNNESRVIGKETPVDKLWIIEGHRYMKTFMELTRGVPSALIRHSWSPKLLDMFAASRDRPEGSLHYKHDRPVSKVNLLILEPNMDYVKSAVVPMTIAEYVDKLRPDLIKEVFVFNWPEKSATADHLIRTLDVGKKTRKFKSLLIDEILTHFNAAEEPFVVISHQLHNPWNYLYYEMFHYGVPLVHNSPDFKQCGYYYSDCNVEEGARAVLNAIEYHTKLRPIQEPKIRQLLDSMDPWNAECGAYWNKLLEAEAQLGPAARFWSEVKVE